jgi:hypothetical protein
MHVAAAGYQRETVEARYQTTLKVSVGAGPFHNEKTLDQGFRAHTSIAQTDTLLVSISFNRPWLGR